MNRLPSHLQIETRHVLTAIMGGEKACAQILATLLVDALADATVLPDTDMPRRPAAPLTPRPASDDGTGAPPPRLPETMSGAASSDASGTIDTAGPAPGGPAIVVKGAPLNVERFTRLWYEADSMALIGQAFGFSVMTVSRVAKEIGLPSRMSAAWEAERELRRRANGRMAKDDAGPVAQSDRAPSGGDGDVVAAPEVAGSHGALPRSAGPAGSPPPPAPAWPAKPKARIGCQFIVRADRNGATTCRAERAPGEVYCAEHLARVRAERGRA